MKKSKGTKKLIIAGLSLLVASSVLTATIFHDSVDVTAQTKVLDEMTKQYSPDKPVKILEIVPTSEEYEYKLPTGSQATYKVNKAAELGYFIPMDKDHGAPYSGTDQGGSPASVARVSRGGVHGEVGNGNLTSESYKDLVRNLYSYGLIAPNGKDTTGWVTRIGEYPIFGEEAIVSKTPKQGCNTVLGGRLVDGYYVPVTDGSGKYVIDTTKYFINTDEHNEIWTVSDNSVTPSVSANKIDDIDTSKLQLPTSTSKGQLIRQANSGEAGNVKFIEREGMPADGHQLYKGYIEDDDYSTLYYSTNDKPKKNSDWWNEYVNGSNERYRYINTPYTVTKASSVTKADIAKYDLIYISGTAKAYKDAGVDLATDVMLEIYNREIGPEHQAVIMDNALYDTTVDPDHTMNITKLAILLWQLSPASLYDDWHAVQTSTDLDNEVFKEFKNKDYFDVQTNATYIPKGSTTQETGERHDLKASALTDDYLWTYLLTTGHMVPADTCKGNFVIGNTYVYNHMLSIFESPKSQVDAKDNFANGDFASKYKQDVATIGFAPVIQYIDAQNTNAGDNGTMSTDITPAVVIQYILVSKGSGLKVMKETLSVLEIEPVPSYLYNPGRGNYQYDDLNSNDAKQKKVIDNRKNFINKYLVSYYADKSALVQFTSMTIAEFNGRSEDLVETYDIIYIGAETTRDGNFLYYPNSASVGNYNWDEKKNDYTSSSTTNISHFNDENLNGNVYYNVGDTVQLYAYRKYDRGIYGWMENEGDLRETNATLELTKFTSRYQGKDFTINKTTKLKEFVNSQALVLVAENLYGSRDKTICNPIINPTVTNASNQNHGYVDTSSNLYEFLEYARGYEFKNGDYVKISDNQSNASIDEGVSANSYSYLNTFAVAIQEGVKENVVSVADIKRNLVTRDSLEDYVATAKLELVLTNAPKSYTYETYKTGDTVERNRFERANGQGSVSKIVEPAPVGIIKSETCLEGRTLIYEFTINAGTGAVEDNSTNPLANLYDINLYIDVNNDGKFSKSLEDVSDMYITNLNTNQLVDTTQGDYKLEAGVPYRIERDLADSFSGLLNWKLVVTSATKNHIHDSETGYTLVKAYNANAQKEETTKEEIHILQICAGSADGVTEDFSARNQGKVDNKTTLGLEALLYRYRMLPQGTTADIMTSTKGLQRENLWGKYLDNLLDYEVTVRTITVRDFEYVYKKKWESYERSMRAAGEQPDSLKFREVFFEDFVVQNVDINDCIETPITHHVARANFDDGNHGVIYGVEEINGANLKKLGYQNETGVDMLVCGFGDAITAFNASEPLYAIQSFIQSGKPVLTTHDFLHYRPTVKQSSLLRNDFGMDLYGASVNYKEVTNNMDSSNPYYMATNALTVTDSGVSRSAVAAGEYSYSHTGLQYTRSNANDAKAFHVLENSGKEVAYLPNSKRGKTAPQTDGVATLLMEESRVNEIGNQSWINILPARGESRGNRQGYIDEDDLYRIYDIEKVNDGKITNFPYRIEGRIEASQTHSQWFTLDLTSDQDGDGESDVVVWYALGEAYDTNTVNDEKVIATNNDGSPKYGTGSLQNAYSDEYGASIDPANGYFIYSDGNVTYTGAGHLNMADAKDKEVQLFVNTLLNTIDTKPSEPTVTFAPPNTMDLPATGPSNRKLNRGGNINSLTIPYDPNVTKPEDVKDNRVDSSVMRSGDKYLYKFVDPNRTTIGNTGDANGTFLAFQIVDNNLLRGKKSWEIAYYLELPTGGSNFDSITTRVAIDGKDNIVYTDNGAVDEEYNGKTIYIVDQASDAEALVTLHPQTVQKRVRYVAKTGETVVAIKTLYLTDEDGNPKLDTVEFKVPKNYSKVYENPNSEYVGKEATRRTYKIKYHNDYYDTIETESINVSGKSSLVDGNHYLIDVSELIKTYPIIDKKPDFTKQYPMQDMYVTRMINGNTDVKKVKRIVVDATTGKNSARDMGVYLPLNLLSDYSEFNLYVAVKTKTTNVATSGKELVKYSNMVYAPFKVIKGDLPDLE